MITMPPADQAVLARRAEIVAALRRIVPGEGVIDAEHERRAYECDGLTAYRQLPLVVVLPETTAQVADVLRYCSANDVKVVPRGAGTSLSGGALPLADGVLLGHGQVQAHPRDRLRQSLRRRAAGRHQSRHHPGGAGRTGFYYAPDPSSQIACTIGGNVAENSGGVHCLKYGLTTNNVLGVEFVTDGRRDRAPRRQAFRRRRATICSASSSAPKGMLGVVTEVTVRILPKPPGARALLIGFPSVEGAGDCVAAIIGAGIIPGGMEIMDRPRHRSGRGFRPRRLSARRRGAADRRARRLRGRGRSSDRRGRGDRRASTAPRPAAPASREAERLLFWAGRKAAFPGGRPHLARLLLHGRHHPAPAAAARCCSA